MTNRFDLEQHILKCWGVTDDIRMLIESEDISNQDLEAVAIVTERKFEALWKCFEEFVHQQHRDKNDERIK